MAKTEDIKRRIGNTPTAAGEEHPNIHGSGSGIQPASRAGAGAVGSKATGGINGIRVGNTPAVVVDIDSAEAKQRHTSQGDEAITSENFPVREHATPAKTVSSGGQFEFSGTPESPECLQRERIPRQEVQDVEVKSPFV